MSFNPLEEKGIPLEKQFRNWSELNVIPFDKNNVDPYTRTRVIAMNGIEAESVFFSHQFARHTDDMDIRRYLAMTRRVEQQQQKAVNWLLPGDSSPLETTIGYEQVAVDLTAVLAQTEPNLYFRQVLEFGLLEDFDHLYRYANLLDMLEGKKAATIVDQLTEITPGRPTVLEHRHPYDDVRMPLDFKTGNPISALHALTIVSAEQQTMNFYMNVGNIPVDPLARGLYLEIAQIEEQHVTQYESMLDPNTTWWEQEVLHQYNECYMYYSFMQQEPDDRIRRLWELHLNMELGQLRLACEMMMKYENKDPQAFLPLAIPTLTQFHSNIPYVRQVLENQVQLTAKGTDFVPITQIPEDYRYYQYQKVVNGDGFIPSEAVIQEHINRMGEDYRHEIAGPNPVPELQQRKAVTDMAVYRR